MLRRLMGAPILARVLQQDLITTFASSDEMALMCACSFR
jgi:hypothetical protein